MNCGISTYRTESESLNSLQTSIAKLNEAYSNGRLENYKSLSLKNSHTDETTCNIQWGPMMRT